MNKRQREENAKKRFADRRSLDPNESLRLLASTRLKETLIGLLKNSVLKNEQDIDLELKLPQNVYSEFLELSLNASAIASDILKEQGKKLKSIVITQDQEDIIESVGRPVMQFKDPIIWSWVWRSPSKKAAFSHAVKSSTIVDLLLKQSLTE